VTDEHPDHDKMQHLFDKAIETDVAHHLIDRLALAWLVDRMTDGNLNVALDAFGDPGTRDAARAEYESLDDQERAELLAAIGPDVNEFTSDAIKRLWHSCRILGFDPETLDPKHVMLVAATLIGDATPTPDRNED
jgi:hypothetical protein